MRAGVGRGEEALDGVVMRAAGAGWVVGALVVGPLVVGALVVGALVVGPLVVGVGCDAGARTGTAWRRGLEPVVGVANPREGKTVQRTAQNTGSVFGFCQLYRAIRINGAG